VISATTTTITVDRPIELEVAKTYTITVYALSGTPKLPKKSTSSVTRDQVISAISGMTISKAVLDVTYSR
jgi:phosphatidylethanolamine-binding protein (PEBP) family uncharacterized protein